MTFPADYLEWPFKPGQRVRVNPNAGVWASDWNGVVLQVVGLRLDRDLTTIRVHVSEAWPADGGADDFDARHLLPA